MVVIKHPAGNALSSDWYVNCFIMAVFPKKFLGILCQKILTELEKYSHRQNYKSISGNSVSALAASCRMSKPHALVVTDSFGVCLVILLLIND